ncbi:BTB/POZ and TAZ domain-containing protein 3-like [Euphorbia lathyris]|uniref:BTB/POZ and TAZ domain-containing protein 3-like n=1 Tax=Euphorbia lathyris TaxID=212925 RepID=UPI003313FD0B
MASPAWDRLFRDAWEGCGADVHIVTERKSYIPAHSNILSMASPFLHTLLEKSKVKKGIKIIQMLGVPHEAVNLFIRFLYTSCFEEEDMKKFVLHLLVLSHAYSIPSLKRVCVHFLEHSWLDKDNVVDVLQLARACDSPRLSFICVRMIVKNFKSISSTDGWKVMSCSNPDLEQELLELREEARLRRIEEKKVYVKLNETMEALLHICRDGCRTIGPCDKVQRGWHIKCKFPACEGLENLLRHYSNCKTRVPGGCVHCKRMRNLLELHSSICNVPEACKVPLCRHFKKRMQQQQSKKDKCSWKLLVSKVIAAKGKGRLGPFSPYLMGL